MFECWLPSDAIWQAKPGCERGKMMAAVDKTTSIFANDRSRRPQTAAPASSSLLHIKPAEEVWNSLRRFTPDMAMLEDNKMIAAARKNPAHVAFDVLRTRMTMALRERGWYRVGITSPTAGCGKSFVAGNLAISFSRQEEMKTVLMDLDLNKPSLAGLFGVQGAGAMSDFLSGDHSVESHFLRPERNLPQIGPNLALGANNRSEMFGSEILQYPSTETALNEAQSMLDPDIMLFDLPPALSTDAVVALSDQLDCVLIVVAGDRSKKADIAETERLIGDTKPILGVVMNKAQGSYFG